MNRLLIRLRGAEHDYRCDCGGVLFNKMSDTRFICAHCGLGYTATPLDPAVDAAGPRAQAPALQPPPASPPKPPKALEVRPVVLSDEARALNYLRAIVDVGKEHGFVLSFTTGEDFIVYTRERDKPHPYDDWLMRADLDMKP